MSTNQEVPTERVTKIMDINFYCLDAIFSSKCLSVMDLCEISETHPHLKQFVDRAFGKRYKNYNMDLSKNSETERRNLRRVLSTFGAFISELKFYGRYWKSEMLSERLNWVRAYCSNTLDSLKFDRMKITEAQLIILQPFFNQLQKISFRLCRVYAGSKTLFSTCESLMELELDCVKFNDQHLLLENTFPKLVRFDYRHWDHSMGIDDSIFAEFFSRHKNLSALRLSRMEGTSNLLPMVLENCKQVIKLEVGFERREVEGMYQKALNSILTLEHLKTLKIRCDGRNITTFIPRLASLKSLQCLRLRRALGDSKLVPALSKLTGLRSLQLLGCFGLTNLNYLVHLEQLTVLKIYSREVVAFDVVPLIKRLISLTILHLHYKSFQMDKRMYRQIVDALRGRSGSRRDTLQISCHTAEDVLAASKSDETLRIIKVENFGDLDSDSDPDSD